MKRGKITQRRTLADGKTVVCVVCPLCNHRHWLPMSHTGECPRRRPGRFTIAEPR